MPYKSECHAHFLKLVFIVLLFALLCSLCFPSLIRLHKPKSHSFTQTVFFARILRKSDGVFMRAVVRY